MYAFKKFIGALAGPLIASLLLLGMAAALRAFGRRRASLWVVATAGVIAYLGSAPWFGALLMGGLERQHPSAVTAALPAVEYIVVLGSGYSPSDGIPITGALDADGLARIVEGIRLSKAMSSARLIVSGGAPEGQGRAAHGYAQLVTRGAGHAAGHGCRGACHRRDAQDDALRPGNLRISHAASHALDDVGGCATRSRTDGTTNQTRLGLELAIVAALVGRPAHDGAGIARVSRPDPGRGLKLRSLRDDESE
jgi:hypothetical protein